MYRVPVFAQLKAALTCSFAVKGFFCPMMIYGLLCVGPCDMWYMCRKKYGPCLTPSGMIPYKCQLIVCVLLSSPCTPSHPSLLSFPLISFSFLSPPCTLSSSPFLSAANVRLSGSSSPHFHRHCFSITAPFCTANAPDAAAVGFRSSALSQHRPIWGNWECASICLCCVRGNIYNLKGGKKDMALCDFVIRKTIQKSLDGVPVSL